MAQFGYFRTDGMEMILCKGSEISYPRHNHVSVLVLGLVLEGAVELVTDGEKRLCGEGAAFAILPYTPHGINARTRYTMLTLCAGVNGPAVPDRIAAAAAAFLHEAAGRPELEEEIRRALSAAQPAGRTVSAPEGPAIGRLRAQLETHPEYRRSIDDMARTALMSRYELIRSFKRQVGLTPHQFQIQNRVRKAQRLLEGTSTMTQAALAAGFCDQSHFIRHFKRLVGLTPTEYQLACGGTPSLSSEQRRDKLGE